MIDLTQLKNFMILARQLNFSNAAKTIGISQPALSMQMKNLELELKIQLFDRKDKHVVLTSPGMALYSHGQELFQKIEDMTHFMNDIREGTHGSIVIGTTDSIGIYILDKILTSYVSKYPNVKTIIKYTRSDSVIELLKNDNIDIGIVAYNPNDPSIEMMQFLHNEFCLVCGKQNALYGKTNISMQEISGKTFIGFEKDTPTRKLIERELKKHHVTVQTTIESDNTETIKKMVEINLGMAILPERSVREEVSQGRLGKIAFIENTISNDIFILHKSNRYHTRAFQEFMKTLHEMSSVL